MLSFRRARAEPRRQGDQLADGDDCVGVAGGAGPGGGPDIPPRIHHTAETVSTGSHQGDTSVDKFYGNTILVRTCSCGG